MVRAALRGAPFYTKARPAIRDGGPAPGRPESPDLLFASGYSCTKTPDSS